MFLSTLLLVALTNFLLHHSEQCEDAPVFTPPSLTVKFGDAASAKCSVCEKNCLGTKFGLEHAVGDSAENGTDIFWKVTSLTEWDTSLLCYYNNKDGRQCAKTLDITLYKPPNRVLASFSHGSDLLLAGQVYVLECLIEEIAPVKHLILTFYKGQEVLGHMYFNSSQDVKPVTKTSNYTIIAVEEDDGAQYWCDARLNLHVQQDPVTVSSQKRHATVHYQPRLLVPTDPDVITVKEGHQLELNCSALGKPTPSYTWTHPAGEKPFSNTSVYSVKSVTFGDEGQYNCTVTNSMGTATVNFSVRVQGNYIGYLIGVPIAAIVLLTVVGLVIYNIYYKHNRTGHFSLVKFNRLCTGHAPVPKSA